MSKRCPNYSGVGKKISLSSASEADKKRLTAAGADKGRRFEFRLGDVLSFDKLEDFDVYETAHTAENSGKKYYTYITPVMSRIAGRAVSFRLDSFKRLPIRDEVDGLLAQNNELYAQLSEEGYGCYDTCKTLAGKSLVVVEVKTLHYPIFTFDKESKTWSVSHDPKDCVKTAKFPVIESFDSLTDAEKRADEVLSK